MTVRAFVNLSGPQSDNNSLQRFLLRPLVHAVVHMEMSLLIAYEEGSSIEFIVLLGKCIQQMNRHKPVIYFSHERIVINFYKCAVSYSGS